MKDILLLHGALGAKSQLEALAEELKAGFRVHLLNLPGHGGEPLPANGMSMQGFVSHVLRFLDANEIMTVSIFGYSMGGYVAMLFAARHPERVSKLVTLATKFTWDETIAAKEIKMLDPDVIREKLPAFAETLINRHAPLNWKEQLNHTQQLLTQLGKHNQLNTEVFQNIVAPCLLMLGDRDKMVTLEETLHVYKLLPAGSLAILPRTAHPLEKTDTALIKFHIEYFILE